VIARLRARHARMWRALLVVVPAVLVAALSVRRGEAARQELPRMLLDETATPLERAQPATNFSSWTWVRAGLASPDGAPRARWLHDATGLSILEVSTAPADGAGERLLYASERASTELEALLAHPAPDFSAADIALPADARLLGAWPVASTRRFAVPAEVAQGRGVLLLYDLVASRVAGVARAPPLPEAR
jgi:hypothetical protein